MITTVLAFLLTIAVLVVIHEYGHYRVAVACGVKVLRFSVGFGRVVWRRQRSPESTEFVVSMLPFGGYVKMLDEREAPVAPEERNRAFNRKPLWQRAAIVSAGPAANLLLAVLLFGTTNWLGIEEPKALLATPTAQSVAERAGLRAGQWARAVSDDGLEWRELRSMNDLRWEITQAVMRGQPLQLMVSERDGRGEHAVTLELTAIDSRDVDAQLMRRIGLGGVYNEPVLGQIKPGGAAHAAGLRPGDRVISVDDRPALEGTQLREWIRNSVSGAEAVPMKWRVERDAAVLEFTVRPLVVVDGERRVGRIEAYIGSPVEMVTVQYGFGEGLHLAVQRTWEMSALTLKMLGKMVIGEASLKNLSGPLTIADYAGQSARLGLAYYIGFLAMVSVSLGVLNLLPLPMLDGGHLMYYLFEGLTGRPVSEIWLERLQRGGMAIMLLMMSLALYNDVARLLGQH